MNDFCVLAFSSLRRPKAVPEASKMAPRRPRRSPRPAPAGHWPVTVHLGRSKILTISRVRAVREVLLAPARVARDILATLGFEMPRERWSSPCRLGHPRNLGFRDAVREVVRPVSPEASSHLWAPRCVREVLWPVSPDSGLPDACARCSCPFHLGHPRKSGLA